MKRILALVNSYKSEIRERQYDIILEQVKTYAIHNEITLLHMQRHEYLEKNLELQTQKITENLTVVTADYSIGSPQTLNQKLRATLKVMNMGRMITQVLMEGKNYDQIHLHESWPLIMLAREIHILKKIPFFLFEYDNDYIYTSYRKRNSLSILPYLAVLFSAHGLQKIFGHTPKLLNRLSRNLNVKKKAVIIPLAIDTDIYRYEADAPRRYIYSELNSSTLQELADVYNILEDYCRSKTDTDIHLYLKTPMQKETFRKIQAPPNLKVHYQLKATEKAHILQRSRYTVILDDNLQEIQLMNQSLCCGTPILSRDSVAIIEDLNPSNSQIMDPNEDIKKAMDQISEIDFDYKEIALQALPKYKPENVAKILKREIQNF